MSSIQGQANGFWEHLRHPLNFHRDNLNISVRDQQVKLLMQSFFCGAIATFLVSLTGSKPLTPASKAGFVLLAVGVTGACFLLLSLSLKLQRVYENMNQSLCKKSKELEEKSQELEKKSKELEEREEQALLKEKQPQVIEQIAKMCDLVSFGESEKCEKMVKLIQGYHLDVNTVFEWQNNKNATFLTIASKHDSPKMILKLLELNADPSQKDENGYNCLHNVIRNVFQDLFPILDNILKRYPDLKIDKCEDQGNFIIRKIIEHNLFKNSSLMDKLLETKGFGLEAQQHLIHFACYHSHEELLQRILKKWAIADKSQNRFINEKAIESEEKWSKMYPLQTLLNMEDPINHRAEQKRMLLSLLEFLDCSKLKGFPLYAILVRYGFHEALKVGGCDINHLRKKWSGLKNCLKYLLENIRDGINKEDYIETFKFLYQPGDPIDPDLQSIYDENITPK